MKNMLFLSTAFLFLASCSSKAIMDAGSGKYISSYADSSFGATGVSASQKAMAEAKAKCGEKAVNVISSSSSPRRLGSFPEATITFDCK